MRTSKEIEKIIDPEGDNAGVITAGYNLAIDDIIEGLESGSLIPTVDQLRELKIPNHI